MKKDNKKFVNVNYICPWCGHNFEKQLRLEPEKQGVAERIHKAAMVKCPKCYTYIKKLSYLTRGRV